MKVCVLQHDIMWANPQGNAERAAHMMDAHADADLYVLPELFATGFPAERPDAATPDWMLRQARERNAAVVGSVAVDAGQGKMANRLLFVRPDGTVDSYDKRHLFGYGGEGERFVAGRRRVVVEWRGLRLLLQVCYDLRFPVFSRNRSDYDAILYVANWPTSRIDVWQTLLRARALENQCYVVGANRVGSDPQCHYCGCSAVIDAYGRTLASCPRDEEGAAEATLDRAALDDFRRKFPVLADADDFSLGAP